MSTHSQPHLPRAAAAQRGATLIFTAFVLLMLVATLGLAVEVGRLYATQQRLQTAANIAALDAARFVGGCRALPDGKTLQEIAQDAVDRNYPNRAAGSVQVVEPFGTGRLVTNADNLRSISADLNGARASAVFLTVQDPSFTPLLGALFDASGPLTASAAAANRPEATISIGSTLAEVDPTILGDLLNVNANLLAQGDLATTSISLAELLGIEANLVTTNGLIEELSVNDALENLGDALTGAAPPIVATVQQLLLEQDGTLFLDEILSVAGEVGSDLSVNAGAIVNAAAQLVAIERGDSIQAAINQNLGIVGGVQLELFLLQPPQIRFGPPGLNPDGAPQNDFPPYFTQVESAQVGLELRLNLLDLNLLGLAAVNLLDLPLAVRGATARAGLQSIDCASASQRSHAVRLDTRTEALRLGVGSFDNDGNFQPETANIAEIKLLGGLLGLTTATIRADSTVDAQSEPVEFLDITNIQDQLPATKPTGDSTYETQDILNALSNLDFEVDALNGLLPINADLIINPIANVLSGPLLGPILSDVLDPILNGLGVSLGSGEAGLLGLDVDQTQLVCTGSTACFPTN